MGRRKAKVKVKRIPWAKAREAMHPSSVKPIRLSRAQQAQLSFWNKLGARKPKHGKNPVVGWAGCQRLATRSDLTPKSQKLLESWIYKESTPRYEEACVMGTVRGRPLMDYTIDADDVLEAVRLRDLACCWTLFKRGQGKMPR